MTRVAPIPITIAYNPGGARWCEPHMRMECTKPRSARQGGGTCHAHAIRGTNSCKNHSGFSRAVAKARGEAKISAWSALGDSSNAISSPMAVIGVLQMSWLRLGAYSELLRRQVVKDGDTAEGVDETDSPESSGLIGHRYGAAGKDGNIFAQSEEVRALVVLESAERDRVVKYAKVAHDMGINDRLINLAERWGDVVATRVTLVLEALELTDEQQARVPSLVQAHLGSIDTGTMMGTE